MHGLQTVVCTVLPDTLYNLYIEIFFSPGYGNFAAETFGGRLFCLIFGIIGIPLMLSVLADVGGLMAEGLEVAWEKNKERVIKLAEKMHIVSQE